MHDLALAPYSVNQVIRVDHGEYQWLISRTLPVEGNVILGSTSKLCYMAKNYKLFNVVRATLFIAFNSIEQ